MVAPLLSLRHVVATPKALNALLTAGQDPAELLDRHRSGDWGEVRPEDAKENWSSVAHGFRILSSYRVGEGHIWIIMEADRSSTYLLLPGEY